MEGGAAYVTNVVDTTGAFELTVPLNPNRLNRLFVSAVDEFGQSSPLAPVDILQDSTPPYLFIDFPTNGMVLTTESTLVAGRVGDALSGFLGLNVTVNGQSAQVDVGIGPNGTYQRTNVTLTVGTNTIQVLATDRLGNSAPKTINVIRMIPVGPRLVAVSGDLQETNILRRLAQPLVVKLTQGDGTPLANKLVDFQVTRSDGRLLPVNTNQLAADITTRPDYSANGTMFLQLFTDASGEAHAWWTMGTDAGHANDRVTVSTKETTETANFCASASALPAKQVNIGSGNNQRGETLAPAPEPLKVWVSDGNNPAARIPVTFRVVQGGGKLVPVVGADGASPAGPGLRRGSRPTGSIALLIPRSSRREEAQIQPLGVPALAGPGRLKAELQTSATPQAAGSSEVTVLTGITGHAEVDFTFGPDSGNQIVEATFPGNAGLPATFVLHALARVPGQPTKFVGLIQDNTSQPIGAARVELEVAGAKYQTASDTQGRFGFSDIASGAGHLIVQGATATSLGTNSIPTNSFPFLQYTITVVPNAENSLPTPVLLPRLNTNNAHWYYGTNDLVVTCEGIEGLQMTIKANSMKHPGGQIVDEGHPALVSLNQVHHDSIPMPMPDGASPPFAWTLQPGGATFDPPVQVEYPNMSGLAPGAAAFFLTFNHDTERFEIVASGHVIEDGSQVVTDSGAGLTISGWGCNCPPYAVTGDCNRCPPPSSDGECGVADTATALVPDCWFFPPEPNAVPIPWVPSGFPGAVCFQKADGTGACDKHDVAWGSCAPNNDYDAHRRASDVEFLNNLRAECDAQLLPSNPFGWAKCTAIAYIYYVVVDADPQGAHRNGQEKLHDDGCCGSGGGGRLLGYAPAAAKLLSPRMPPPFEDRDNDALPDEWESQMGLSTADPLDTFKDPDHDGLRNVQEFLNGTDPFDPDTDGDGINDRRAAETARGPLPIVLDDTWSLTINGQAAKAGRFGSFRFHNVSAPDQFGVGGPNTAPDFVSDDFVRLLGVKTVDGTNHYLFSEFFQIRQGATISITNLTFTDIPPRKPESLSIVCTNRILRLGQNTPLTVLARFADSSTTNVAPRTSGTSYRVSNPNIATVSPDGVVMSLKPGVLFVTAVNEGASAVCGLNVVAGVDGLTTVTGTVVDPNGVSIAGARVRIYDLAIDAVITDASGHFTLADVPTTLGPLGISVRVTVNGRTLTAFVRANGMPAGTTALGNIVASIPSASDQPRFAAGDRHTVALHADGTLWAWGNNEYGQLGNGTFTSADAPQSIQTNVTWKAVAAGGDHSVALREDGTLWAWGRDDEGQLGNGTFQSTSTPQPIQTNVTWTAVAAGYSHTVALREDGTLWAWGYNDLGQLGNGTFTSTNTPQSIQPNVAWEAVAAGDVHTVALREDGTLWAWGQNGAGQLGDGTDGFLTSTNTPQPIQAKTGQAKQLTAITGVNERVSQWY